MKKKLSPYSLILTQRLATLYTFCIYNQSVPHIVVEASLHFSHCILYIYHDL